MTSLPQFTVDLFGRQELRQQQDHGGQESLGGVVEEGVLPEAVPLGIDDGLGQDFGVLFRLGPGRQVIRVGRRLIHIGVGQGQKIEPVRPGGVAQVDDGHLVAVVLFRDGPIVPGQIPLGVQGQEAHPAGAGIFQVGIQEEGRLAHARRANHEAVDVVTVHQGSDLALPALGAQHQPLHLGEILSPPPPGGVEGDAVEGFPDLRRHGPAGGAVLAVAHRLGFDAVQ